MSPVVVDANVLFSALLREGTTRHLILHAGLNLHTPDTIWDEFDRNRAYLLRKSAAGEASLDLLLDGMRARIADVPLEVIRPHMKEALRRLGPRDRLDAPYVAACVAIGASLWSHDRRLARKARVPVVTTADLAEGPAGPSRS